MDNVQKHNIFNIILDNKNIKSKIYQTEISGSKYFWVCYWKLPEYFEYYDLQRIWYSGILVL
jgi:hypothetical protein